MSTHPISNITINHEASRAGPSVNAGTVAGSVTLAGRFFFSLIFLLSGPMHFSPADINYAIAAGVPFAKFLVPASGVLAFLGALSILLGYHAKIGAWMIALFLLAITPVMHNFWAVQDAATQQIQMAMFMKNASMLGGALLISQLGAGRWSLDERQAARSS
jgi:putative oxidoreductase